ncbi:CPBP family intramembrane glutamic endopeptidase [Algoriphagus machipongonensis]|uniref:Metal-dependent membrane protease n=1 Tax=Algoriphagus machipongonensis TaxID=388413 RepID=A3HW66_9BACT|nr:CPBP family intramembrane glutamic endopeptidase [Algoriphagus machipongonensis]EAZ82388.1 metal-dependent membrane protease [Algoriphagus machipongonensis]
MEIYETHSEIAQRKSWLLSLIVIVLVAFGVLILLQGIALALVPILFNIPVEQLLGLFNGDLDVPNGRMAMLFVQGLGSGLGFWLAAWIITNFIEKANLHWDVQISRFQWKALAVVLIATTGGMLFNSLLIFFNSNLALPEFMSEVENWMRSMEDQMMELTKYLTDFQTIPELIAGIFVIGILAGIGEEMFFRGLLQPKMHQYFKSGHLGIWVTAIIFSSIHFQFFGFLPRVFLGAIFGYMYLYSGSLLYPILGHIFNNTFTVIMVYMAKQGMIDFDLESTDEVSYVASLLGLLVLVAGIYYLKKMKIPKDGKLDQSI